MEDIEIIAEDEAQVKDISKSLGLSPSLPPRIRRVVLALADLYPPSSTLPFHPNQAELHRRTGYSRRWIWQALIILVQQGKLIRLPPPGSNPRRLVLQWNLTPDHSAPPSPYTSPSFYRSNKMSPPGNKEDQREETDQNRRIPPPTGQVDPRRIKRWTMLTVRRAVDRSPCVQPEERSVLVQRIGRWVWHVEPDPLVVRGVAEWFARNFARLRRPGWAVTVRGLVAWVWTLLRSVIASVRARLRTRATMRQVREWRAEWQASMQDPSQSQVWDEVHALIESLPGGRLFGARDGQGQRRVTLLRAGVG